MIQFEVPKGHGSALSHLKFDSLGEVTHDENGQREEEEGKGDVGPEVVRVGIQVDQGGVLE